WPASSRATTWIRTRRPSSGSPRTRRRSTPGSGSKDVDRGAAQAAPRLLETLRGTLPITRPCGFRDEAVIRTWHRSSVPTSSVADTTAGRASHDESDGETIPARVCPREPRLPEARPVPGTGRALGQQVRRGHGGRDELAHDVHLELRSHAELGRELR